MKQQLAIAMLSACLWLSLAMAPPAAAQAYRPSARPTDPFAYQLPPPPTRPDAEAAALNERALIKRRQAEERENVRAARRRRFFSLAAADAKHRVYVERKDGAALEGFVVSAKDDRFVLRDAATQQERTILYTNTTNWHTLLSPREQAQRNARNTGLILLAVPFLPFVLLAMAAGWDGC